VAQQPQPSPASSEPLPTRRRKHRRGGERDRERSRPADGPARRRDEGRARAPGPASGSGSGAGSGWGGVEHAVPRPRAARGGQAVPRAAGGETSPPLPVPPPFRLFECCVVFVPTVPGAREWGILWVRVSYATHRIGGRAIARLADRIRGGLPSVRSLLGSFSPWRHPA